MEQYMDNKKMNLWMFLVIAFIAGILIGGGTAYILKGGASGSGYINLYPPKSGSEWLVKIDDYVITKADFEEGYKYLLSQIPPERQNNLPPDTKKQYFESMINQYIMTIKALNEGILKSPVNSVILDNYIRQVLAQLYIQKNLPLDKSSFVPSKMEMDEFYNQHKAELDRAGMKSDQLKQVIVQEIERQKQQVWLQQFMAQVRETIKIQRNNDLLQQEGISMQPQNNLILPMPTNAGSNK